MCGKKELFSALDELVRGEVNFGDRIKISIIGKGKILIWLTDGSHEHVLDVYYVPSLHWNLLSLGQLSKKGHKIFIENGVCIIQNRRNELIPKVNMTRNRMFPLSLYTKMMCAFSSLVKDTNWLWHF